MWSREAAIHPIPKKVFVFFVCVCFTNPPVDGVRTQPWSELRLGRRICSGCMRHWIGVPSPLNAAPPPLCSEKGWGKHMQNAPPPAEGKPDPCLRFSRLEAGMRSERACFDKARWGAARRRVTSRSLVVFVSLGRSRRSERPLSLDRDSSLPI